MRNVLGKGRYFCGNTILAFPTEEMRKELKEKLENFPDEMEVFISEDHFESDTKCDDVSNYNCCCNKDESKCFIHYWAL